MSLRSWFGLRSTFRRDVPIRRRRNSVTLSLEPLEPRDLLSAASVLAQAPLAFQANAGQFESQVQFAARGPNYSVALSDASATLSLSEADSYGADGVTPTSALVTMTMVGANPNATATGKDRDAGTTNFLVGSSKSQWLTGIANYGKVKYQDVYPGINVVYYGTQRELEYDFKVAAKANPAAIQLSFTGAQATAIDANGNLVLQTDGGSLVVEAPQAYQKVGGAKVPVSVSYVLESNGQVGFQLGAYNHNRALVIDPVLNYSSYVGGSGSDGGYSIAVDSSGNIYVTGLTSSPNFPIGSAQQAADAGTYDAFVTKIAPNGALAYSTYLGGSGYDMGTGITVDSSGNAYVVGETSSTNFPVTSGAAQSHNAGGLDDAFIAKLNSSGTLSYSSYLGGSGDDAATGVAVDSTGKIYVTGTTTSTNFPTTTGAYQTTEKGGYDAFVVRLTTAGAINYSTLLGGSGDEASDGIAVDSSGNMYVTGYTSSSNFPTTSGVFQTTFKGTYDAFITKFTSAGKLSFSTYLGGTGDNEGWDISVDSGGNTYIAGYTNATDFPTTSGVAQRTLLGGYGAFVTRLNSNGTMSASTYLSGNGSDMAFGIALDAESNIYVVGLTSSTNFPTTAGAPQTIYGGGTDDAFVTELSSAFKIVSSTYLGGSGDDEGYAIALDSAGGVYVTGMTNSRNFGTTTSALQTVYGGGSYDAFVAKIGALSATTTSTVTVDLANTNTNAPNPLTYGQGVTLSATVTASGGFTSPTGTVQFQSGSTVLGTATLSTTGGVTSASLTLATLPVGTLSITATYSGDSNFSGSTGTAVSKTVNPAPLTITANNATQLYEMPTPSFSVQYSGFVLGQNASVLGGQLTISTTATSNSPPGTYAITPAGLTSSNYAIHYVNGTLTIVGSTYQVVPDPLNPSTSLLEVVGTSGGDTIQINPGTAAGTLQATINNVTSPNISPLSGTSFSAVAVYGGDGNDWLQISSSVTVLGELFAGGGNDVLIGGGGNNILVSGGGGGFLIGGTGRNIMIGGTGGAFLDGGTGDNLEIAGTTNYDGNQLALESIMAEWASADSYTTRVNDILGVSNPSFAQRSNGNYFFNTSTVQGDTSGEYLVGGPGQDWFFANLARDTISNQTSGEVVTPI
jgi:hypothetical protein